MSGLEGLGNINTRNDSCTVGTPLQSNDFVTVKADNRLLSNDISQFSSTEQFGNYLIDWFQKTGVVEITEVDTTTKQLVGGYSAFGAVLEPDVNTRYCIVGCLTIDNVRNLISSIDRSTIMPNSRIVAICFADAIQMEKNKAKKINMEIIGNETIREINSAITSSLPYIASNNSFGYKIASTLNGKYRADNRGNFGGIANNLSSASGSIVNSFKEGFTQLKDSVVGAVNSLGGVKKQLGLGTSENSNNAIPQIGGNEEITKEQETIQRVTQNEQIIMPKTMANIEPEVMTSEQSIEPEVTIEKPSEDVPYGTDLTPGTLDGPKADLTKQMIGEDIVTPGTLEKENETEYEKVEETFETTGVVVETDTTVPTDTTTSASETDTSSVTVDISKDPIDTTETTE